MRPDGGREWMRDLSWPSPFDSKMSSIDEEKMKDVTWSSFEERMNSMDSNWKHPQERPGFRATFFQLFEDFWTPEVYRAAVIEFCLTASFVFLSVNTVIASLQSAFASDLAALCFLHVILVTILIYTGIPTSGGHFNPVITVCNMLMGHCSVPRSVLYVVFQAAGSIVGAEAAKAVVEPEVGKRFALAGCLLRQKISVDGVPTVSGLDGQQGFISEFIFTFTFILMVYPLAFDPKRRGDYGPIIGPILCGLLVGSFLFISGALKPGYTGAGFNPARCLGPAVVMGGEIPGLWRDYWVYSIAPMCACVLQAFIAHLIPVDHSEAYIKKQAALHVMLRAMSSKPQLITREERHHHHPTHHSSSNIN